MSNADFITICKDRGFFHQCTDVEGLRELLSKQSGVPAYIGFDCTAPSLHAGSLVPIMMLYWWQQCSHKPIVLMGGGTTKVGDPSGKDTSRKMLTEKDIEANKAGIKQVFEKFLRFGEGEFDATMVDNAEWLDGLNYITLLRDVGRHFSVNKMLSMESVKQRLERESHLSFLEFNYMILQSYDFVELNDRYGCRVQMGGSDQWGNIVMGTELNRRMKAAESESANIIDELFGFTSPLLTTSSGAKMGKTAEGAVWLNAEMCSPYDYWQYWRNTEDGDVIRFLKLFTTLPLEQIAEYESWLGTAQINEAKKILATETTALLHGRVAAEAAEETARKTFEQGGVGGELPEITLAQNDLEAGLPAFKIFVEAGLASSGGEARRTIKGGGARCNDEKIADESQTIGMANMTDDGYIKLSMGKKKHVLVRAA